MTDLTETFWVAFVGTIIGFLGLTLKMCLKSKCDNVEVCCIKIHRNVEIEQELDELELTRNPADNSNHI
jgi:hypothetical protein